MTNKDKAEALVMQARMQCMDDDDGVVEIFSCEYKDEDASPPYLYYINRTGEYGMHKEWGDRSFVTKSHKAMVDYLVGFLDEHKARHLAGQDGQSRSHDDGCEDASGVLDQSTVPCK